MNKTIMTNDEWAVGFMEQLDSMLDGIESMNEKSKASFGNERFLTDKEVSAWLKVSRRTLQDYRNNGMVSYYQLGGKIVDWLRTVKRTNEWAFPDWAHTAFS